MPLKTKAELYQLVGQLYEILKSHDVATCVQLLHTLQTDAVRSCAEIAKSPLVTTRNKHGVEFIYEFSPADAIVRIITEQPL